MNIGNNPNIATRILVIIVIIMSILGTTSFVLFFTHCPPSCNISSNTESFKQNKQRNISQNKQRNISQNKPHEYATQLIPIEDLFNDF